MKNKSRLRRTSSNTYVSRGPSNLGGSTRAFAVDISDATSNTILSGGVSSGLFRTTNGGQVGLKYLLMMKYTMSLPWLKTQGLGIKTIGIMPLENGHGNSASLGASYRWSGFGTLLITGLTWAQISR